MTGAVAAGGMSAPALPVWFTELFAHRRWVRRRSPFPHVYARDVFTVDFHRRLAEEYARVRRERIAEFRADGETGATAIPLTSVGDGPLALFTTREWHELIAGVAGIAATGAVGGMIECQPPGGVPSAPRSGLEHTGSAIDPEIAVIFHLEGTEGHGGGTALYADLATAPPEPAVIIPPLDNSILLFECTPRTWHAFAGGDTAEYHRVTMRLRGPRRGGDTGVER